MKINYSKLFVVLFAITLFLSNCAKKGDPGAQGPAGQNGAAGTAGPQGPKGDAGVTNVFYSAWLDVTYLPDTVHNGSKIDTLGFYSNISAPKLDASILSQGEIRMYVNLNNATDPAISPLPYIDLFSGISITATFLVQKINVYSNIDAGTVNEQGTKYLQYRYIFIPGNTKILRSMVDLNNYNAVKKFYGIKD